MLKVGILSIHREQTELVVFLCYAVLRDCVDVHVEILVIVLCKRWETLRAGARVRIAAVVSQVVLVQVAYEACYCTLLPLRTAGVVISYYILCIRLSCVGMYMCEHLLNLKLG